MLVNSFCRLNRFQTFRFHLLLRLINRYKWNFTWQFLTYHMYYRLLVLSLKDLRMFLWSNWISIMLNLMHCASNLLLQKENSLRSQKLSEKKNDYRLIKEKNVKHILRVCMIMCPFKFIPMSVKDGFRKVALKE